jgi:DnaJ-class molecular chaperone
MEVIQMNPSPPSIPETNAADQRNPGDEVPPGTPQTGEDICPECNGSGKKADQGVCPNCGGTGLIVVNVGDA